MNLQIQRTLVFETSAIPGYATSALGVADRKGLPAGEAAKWTAYLPVFVQGEAAGLRVLVEFRPRRQPDRAVELAAGATVGDLLRAVGESADHTLAVRGQTPVTEAEPLRDGESILLLSAFSGG